MTAFTKAHKEHNPLELHPHLSNGGPDARPSYQIKDALVENFRPMKVIVIGAGFSGIYCAVRMPQRLRNVQVTVYEKNSGVGGTWYENRYPGCACDIPAHSYQYSFEPNPNWSRFYAPAVEIRKYLEGVVEKYSAGRFIKCSHKVTACQWDETTGKWHVTVENLITKESFLDEADVVVSARGTLNAISWPNVKGMDTLTIPKMHSAAWDQSYDFTGKRIGVIGGGSSAIQIVPELQKLSGTKLSCFVRSKTWISRPFGDSAVGKLGLQNLEFTDEQKTAFINDKEHFLKFRKIIESESNSVHALTLKGTPMQDFVRDNFAQFMKERLRKKPEVFGALLPDFSVGCRRLTPGPGYLEALTEDNVEFITTAITKVHPTGVELSDGRSLDFDVLVCATGFSASAPPPFPVTGRNEQTVAARFDPYPETYLSLAIDGFPNFFMMLGPNAAIGTGSLTMMMEMEGDYIIKAIRKMQKEDIRSMEAKSERVKDFSEIIDSYFKGTVYLDRCNSWYRSKGGSGDRISGLWPGSTLHAMEVFRSPRWEDYNYVYEGEMGGKQSNRLRWLGNGWSSTQVDDEGGDLAYYLSPEFLDAPAYPLPEKSRIYQLRPFSY